MSSNFAGVQRSKKAHIVVTDAYGEELEFSSKAEYNDWAAKQKTENSKGE